LLYGVQRFRHCQKISQMPQFHRSRALCRKGIAAQATWHWAKQTTNGKLVDVVQAKNEQQKGNK
jgi:hypothetical protein